MAAVKSRSNASLTAEDLGISETEEEDILEVLDLPQLYLKPSAPLLLETLADLSSQPPSWNTTPRSGTPRSPLSGASTPLRRKRKVRSEGLPRYLTKIISSPLAWIENDDHKEQIWEAAAQRLSERSGRSAMSDLSRTFVIGVHNEAPASNGDVNVPAEAELELTLHEPALTADNLGLKTWASSYLLAQRMCILRETLPALPQGSTILELGSGTGLVGLAAAVTFRTRAILTDLPAIVPNLERNAHSNAATLASYNAEVDVTVLDWSQPETFRAYGVQNGEMHNFPLILVADPIYSPDHPRLLVQAIEYHLSRESDARVIVELPLRDAYGAERNDFRSRMSDVGLFIADQGEETGVDDWSNSDDELMEVRCWWSVWAWHRQP